MYVHVTENTEGRAGEREIQYRGVRRCFWMEGLTVWMYHEYVKQTDRHAERNRVYTQYYVLLCHKIKLGDFQWQAAIRG